jgi:nitronate monooxygenase
MTGVGTPELTVAVSNAGGPEMIDIHNAGSPEQGHQWIPRLRNLSDKPFGVNLTILPSMGLPPPYMQYVQVIVLEEGVEVVKTEGSNPSKFIQFFKRHGFTTIHKCVTIIHPLSAGKYGINIISLDGMECAGHPGEDNVGSFVLHAKGTMVLKKPCVCSRGIGTGSQLAAALSLGTGYRWCQLWNQVLRYTRMFLA